MKTKWATDKVMPLVPRHTLFDEPWDTSRECWTVTRDDGKGQIHIGYVPWLFRTVCPSRMICEPARYVWEWMPFPRWGESSNNWVRLCKHCYRQPVRPWEFLLPSGFSPPVTRDEAGVIADWWEENPAEGSQAKAECIRSWCKGA